MFTYSIQLAGYDYTQYDEKSQIDLPGFLNIIDQFPWMEQLEKYSEIQEGCSATVFATNQDTNNSLWVSIAGNKNKYSYLVGYVYPKTSKGFLGLGREKTKKWLDIYRVNDFALIKSFFSIFFDNETLLQEQLSLEEKFDSMPAQN
jgi:hypothetical protein